MKVALTPRQAAKLINIVLEKLQAEDDDGDSSPLLMELKFEFTPAGVPIHATDSVKVSSKRK